MPIFRNEELKCQHRIVVGSQQEPRPLLRAPSQLLLHSRTTWMRLSWAIRTPWIHLPLTLAPGTNNPRSHQLSYPSCAFAIRPKTIRMRRKDPRPHHKYGHHSLTGIKHSYCQGPLQALSSPLQGVARVGKRALFAKVNSHAQKFSINLPVILDDMTNGRQNLWRLDYVDMANERCKGNSRSGRRWLERTLWWHICRGSRQKVTSIRECQGRHGDHGDPTPINVKSLQRFIALADEERCLLGMGWQLSGSIGSPQNCLKTSSNTSISQIQQAIHPIHRCLNCRLESTIGSTGWQQPWQPCGLPL